MQRRRPTLGPDETLDRLAVCDDGYARRFGLPIDLPPGTRTFEGRSTREEAIRWRRDLRLIDLVFIDGDHSFAGVRRDFEIQRAMPHRFLAFHDIYGTRPQTIGERRFWQQLDTGH